MWLLWLRDLHRIGLRFPRLFAVASAHLRRNLEDEVAGVGGDPVVGQGSLAGWRGRTSKSVIVYTC